MGGGGSAMRNNATAATLQRQPSETHMSYKIRVKFQTDKFNKAPWFNDVVAIFGENPLPVKESLDLFHKKLRMNITEEMLKDLYGMSETHLGIKHISHIYADLTYNPSIGAIFSALVKDREGINEHIWAEFLVEFQGYHESQLASVEKLLEEFTDLKSFPKTAPAFSAYLLGPANSAFHPSMNNLQRFDRPLSEYFICVAKIPGLEDCPSPKAAVSKLAETIFRGARVLEIQLSGGASDRVPRCFADIYPPGTDPNKLPTFAEALEIFNAVMEEVYGPESTIDTECASSGEKVGAMPFVVVLTVRDDCSEEDQKIASDELSRVFGEKLNCPSKNADGTIWSPMQLQGKVLLIGPPAMVSDGVSTGKVLPSISTVLSSMIRMKMLTVYEIRPILDQAKSRSELRRLLQDIVLTLSPTELCAHIMELSSITDMLLVHVQASKRKMMRVKGTNLKESGSEYDGTVDQDVRHVVQFSELRPGDALDIETRFSTLVIMEDSQEEIEPLRGWRYGAQMVPVDFGTRSEAAIQNMSLFKQQSGNGYVPRLPRIVFNNFPGFTDFYADFPTDFARSLFVTLLSGSHLPRDMGVSQPFVRIYCNNGTGLKQVAITSTVDDNGCNLIWEEDFEFKFHVNDLNSAACLLFVANDRDKEVGGELGFAAVPLWGLQSGYRSLQLYDMHGEVVKNGVLFAHFDWEQDE